MSNSDNDLLDQELKQIKAIEKLKELKEYRTTYYGSQWFKVEVCADEEMKNTIDIILSLIQTQQEESDLLKIENQNKDKMINLMAIELKNQFTHYEPCCLSDIARITQKQCKEQKCTDCVKQYFEEKMNNDK